jgi:hypothetical protein
MSTRFEIFSIRHLRNDQRRSLYRIRRMA